MSPWLLLLVPLLALAFDGLFDSGGDDDDDEPSEPPTEPTPVDLAEGDDDFTGTAEADWVVAGDGFSGNVDGGAGDDTLAGEGTATGTVNIVSPYSATAEWWDPEDGPTAPPDHIPGVIALRGGEGADDITASGFGLDIDGGAGADRLDLGALQQGIVHLGAGDSVAAPTGSDTDIHWLLGEGAALDLSEAGDGQTIHQAGTGASVTGSAGGDWMLTRGGDVAFHGGAGDDTLAGNYTTASDAGTSYRPFDMFIGLGNDSLDGGAGDDSLTGDLGDTLTGGEGADSLTLWLQEGSTAHVTDYDPAVDSLLVHVDAATVDSDQIGVVERDGSTAITVGGEDVAVLEGQTGLSVALGSTESPGQPPVWRDLQGNPLPTDIDGSLLDPDSYGVVIDRYTT